MIKMNKIISLINARIQCLEFMKKMEDERNNVIEETFEDDEEIEKNNKPIGNFDEYSGPARGSLPGDDHH